LSILVTNFQKSSSLLIFNIGDLKFRDLAKSWFFKLMMTKSNFKIWLWHHFSNVITITSSRNVTKITSQKIFQFKLLQIKISGYACSLGLIIWWC